MAPVTVVLFLFITSTYCVSLPGIKNYLLTHNNPADLAALELSRQNITDDPDVLEINEETVTDTTDGSITHDVTAPTKTGVHDEVPHLKQITVESSEVAHKESELDRNVSEDINGTDSDKLADTQSRIKIPVSGHEETPQLPTGSWFKPGGLSQFSLFSKPKPVPEGAGLGTKTVYVQATKTIKEQPMCITVYGLKPPCHNTNSFNQGYYGVKSLDEVKPDGDQKAVHSSQQDVISGSGDTDPSTEARSLSEPLSAFPMIKNDDVFNEDEDTNEDIPDSPERTGRFIMFRNHHAKTFDGPNKIIPNKVAPSHHIVTETIYATKVQKQHGATATLVVENCVPINSHIPFCGNIYPIYQVNEIPTNYFHVQIPVMHGKYPVSYKPNYQQTSIPVSNPFTPHGGYQQPGSPELSLGNSQQVPIQNYPPISLLHSHLPGFLNRISNFHGRLHTGIHNIGKLASTVTQNLAQGVHSHFQHQKVNCAENGKPLVGENPQEGLEGSPSEIVEIGYKSKQSGEDIKPVKEEPEENVSLEKEKEQTPKTEDENLHWKITSNEQQNIENGSKNSTNTSDMVKSLNAAIVKQLSEITSSGATASIHNFTQTSTEPTTIIQRT